VEKSRQTAVQLVFLQKHETVPSVTFETPAVQKVKRNEDYNKTGNVNTMRLVHLTTAAVEQLVVLNNGGEFV
jgi:hypothetical protein